MSGPLALLTAVFSNANMVDSAADPDAMEAAVGDLCGREVALLGEASHGDGETAAFKVALVRRLVSECGFNAIFFESSHYDFLEFERLLAEGVPVTTAMLGSAVGGLWSGDREFQPLLSFLLAEARAGRLRLGGLDDQLGSANAFYSLEAMARALAAHLGGARSDAAREVLERRIFWRYSRQTPYDPKERDRVIACVAEIEAAVKAGKDGPRGRAQALQELANIHRLLNRDFSDPADQLRERARSMHANFRWLADRLPPGSRIVVWAGTSHVARDASVSGQYGPGENLGALIDRDHGDRSFALAFSAAGGSHRNGRDTAAILPAAADSLEARALAGCEGAGAVYLGPSALANLGTVPASVFFHRPATADWHRVLGGIVVFREERPPTPAE
ncbi:hypothetical protein D7Y23_30310 [Corallococcus sp. AB050B]|nr:hypothetical protein D7Y23_30310 [Corallococcus sp. AB050B]